VAPTIVQSFAAVTAHQTMMSQVGLSKIIV